MISESQITVRYAETDQMGIVHHANYPIWYEVARTDFIRKIGISYTEMEQKGIMVPLIALSCKYFKPAYYEDELIIKTSIASLTPVKVTFQYQIFNQKDHFLLNTGTTTHAWVGKDFKPLHMKKQFPDIYISMQNTIELEK